jgi:hypothetical protein
MTQGAGPRPTGQATRRPKRWVWAVLVGVSLTASSCTVDADGYAGVMVDPQGVVRAVVQSCKHSVDGASLYWGDDPRGADSDHAEMGTWKFARSTVGAPLTWPLNAARAPAVRATTRVKKLARGRTYTLYGWTEDNSWSTGNVEISLTEVETLRPGRVLLLDAETPPREVSQRRFAELVCQ